MRILEHSGACGWFPFLALVILSVGCDRVVIDQPFGEAVSQEEFDVTGVWRQVPDADPAHQTRNGTITPADGDGRYEVEYEWWPSDGTNPMVVTRFREQTFVFVKDDKEDFYVFCRLSDLEYNDDGQVIAGVAHFPTLELWFKAMRDGKLKGRDISKGTNDVCQITDTPEAVEAWLADKHIDALFRNRIDDPMHVERQ